MTHNTPLLDAAVSVAMECIATGETLLPFVITEGGRGAILSIDAEEAAEQIAMAQRSVDDLPAEASAWAFAYDGYLTLDEEKTDAVFFEVGERSNISILVYAQRYRPANSDQKVEMIGVLSRLPKSKPRLNNARFSEKKTPNQAPEPTTMAVTARAPSSTSRASQGRGSS